MADVANKIILLVEDDRFLGSLLSNRLKKDNFNVLLAKDGNEAVVFLEKNKVDLILMDLILPAKSGFEMIDYIRQIPAYAKIPVMVVSNLGQEADVQRAKEMGVIKYFVKAQTPIDDLVKEIGDFLSK